MRPRIQAYTDLLRSTEVFILFIVDPENKFTFSDIYVIVYDYGIFNRFTQTRP